MSFIRRLILILVISISCSFLSSGQVLINEICSANGDIEYDPDFYNFSGWIELYNSGNSAVDISGYFISDDELEIAKWQVPPGTTIAPNEYLIIWCDKKNTGYHTNFSLDSDGEVIIFSNVSQAQVDKITFPKQYTNVSYGRLNNGSTIGFLTSPSLNGANNDSSGTVRLDNPTVSLKSGRYPSAQTATITHATPGAVIRYTLDGSEPTPTSVIYTNPIAVNKTLTLKAKAFASNFIPSKSEVKTYFINEHTFSLPVVSISTNPNYLFDDQIGIYTEGTNGIIDNCTATPANWNQDWHRHAVFEYFEPNGNKKFDYGVDIRIGGGCSRRRAQKSFIVSADDKYGSNHMNEKLFDNKNADRYADFMYRNGGNDFQLHFRDALMQLTAAAQMDVDYLDYKPTTFYLNGEYWGIQNMREKPDGDFIESNYGVSKDDIDMIEGLGKVIEGSLDAYDNYIDSLEIIDLADPASFAFIDKHIDVQEYINYLTTEIYFCNTDWPNNNVKFWRQRSTNGKFRWILWDLDFGLGQNSRSYSTHPTLEYVTDDASTGSGNTPASTLHIRLVLQNPVFKERFIKTLNTAMSSTFSPPNFNKQIEIFQNRIKTEMPYHKERWGGTMENWAIEIERAKKFILERQFYMNQHMADFFGLNESIQLRVFPNIEAAGSFHLNNTIISPVVDGPYFKGTSYTVKAVPSTGYRFKQWNITKANVKPITVAKRGDTWKYFDQGSLPPGGDWTSTTFDDTSWLQGEAELGYGDGDEKTIVNYGGNANNKFITTYFRKKFQIDGADIPDIDQLMGGINFDDGVIVYLNGTEVYRDNMPSGNVTYSTLASGQPSVENVFESITINKNLLQAGDNVLAIEVHQAGATSSDISFDFELYTAVIRDSTVSTSTNIEITETAELYTTMEAVFETVTPVTGIVINEIGASSPGITDDFNEQEDWIELYNAGTTSVDLAGFYLTDDPLQKAKYQIPKGVSGETEILPNSYKLLWADSDPGQGPLHLSFKLSADGEAVGLYQLVGKDTIVIDEVSFPSQPAQSSFARIPNITGPFLITETITPGSENILKITTAVEDYPNPLISVYPNPARDEIKITASELIHQATLYNIFGIEMEKSELNALNGSLSMAHFPDGIYILLVETGTTTMKVKVIKR
jgi:hypothetical protein